MSLRHLKTLVTIADQDSFLAAADQLFITPAAVSLQMKTLEAELATTLFDRSTRPPRLNAHGRSLITQARSVLLSYDAFVDAAASEGELAGRLTLGSVTGVTSALLPRALSNLRQRYPRLQMRIEEGLSAPLTRKVRRRELDAAIVTEGATPEPDLLQLPILEEPLVLVSPADGEGSTWREVLARQPFLRINRSSGVGAVIDRTLREGGVSVSDAMELDSSEAVMQMAAAGLGAGVVSEGRVSGEAAQSLRLTPFGDPQAYRRVVLVERRNNPRSDLARVLYDELQSLVSAQTAASKGFT